MAAPRRGGYNWGEEEGIRDPADGFFEYEQEREVEERAPYAHGAPGGDDEE